MSKPVTFADLKEALKPNTDAINKLNETVATALASINELYLINTNISTKLDLLDQKNNAAVEPAAPAKKVRKPPVKKATTKKAPTKSATKSKSATEDQEEDQDQEDQEEPNKEEQESEKESKSKKVAKKVVKKVNTDADAEEGTDVDAESEADADPSEKNNTKKAKKPAMPVKKATKSTAVKSTTKGKRDMNKMEFFNIMYDSDQNYFDMHITEKDKASIAKKNAEAWKGLSDEELYTQKRSAYYHFMKDNKDSFLVTMKKEYLTSNNAEKVNIVSKEDD